MKPLETDHKQARVFPPLMFIEQEPQIPSRQERRKVSVGSISFLILIKASNTMGPHLFRSISYVCMWGLSPGLSGFYEKFDINSACRTAKKSGRESSSLGML